jgi:hypothetical protein
MPQFEGTIKEFTKYVGAFTRLKVTYISSQFKKQIGVCQDCGIVTKGLDCAHVKGRERPIIISEILSEFIDGDIVKVDLEEFEDKFVEAHTPIENTIRILCKECHNKYDNRKSLEPSADADVQEKKEMQEGELIEQMVKAKLMNKAKAILQIKNSSDFKLSSTNTIFSNLTKARNVWWFEPRNEKFKSDLYLVMNDESGRKFYLFHLPANTITHPENTFRQRNDRIRSNCSDIYIPKAGDSFQDEKGFNFGPYLIDKFDY